MSGYRYICMRNIVNLSVYNLILSVYNSIFATCYAKFELFLLPYCRLALTEA